LRSSTLVGAGIYAAIGITRQARKLRDKRGEFSRALQSVTGQAGLQATHAIRRKTPADDFLLQLECLFHFKRKRVGSSHHRPASINPYVELGAFRAAACYILPSRHDTLKAKHQAPSLKAQTEWHVPNDRSSVV